MVESRIVIRNCVINLTNILLEEVEEILEEERNPKKRIWCREWLTRRESQGASTNLIRELRFEDPKEYRMMLRMTAEKFDYLLGLITPLIQRENTIMKDAIKPETMLEVTLNYLATGNNYRTLSHLFRVSKSAISIMIPIVCQAVYDCLKDFVKVCE
ncbi:unnamed protein product [Acanthoscelides obtectus]|uniref:Nuclease HARBI1 n=1 Tax=Acanthoscelides obtectus TaxID=200917 RepID=A0A9P0Q694_ACAOB|nr:unnamed protein product [Acanthoscelides obtectus]CAK1670107.1 hypothetical protein AOBTE_LOCUS27408 [Acanthoscelides obtectus]